MAAISSRYPGYCSKCRTQYPAGTGIVKVGQKWAHEECPAILPEKNSGKLYAAGPQRATEKRNRKADSCQDCGAWVATGEGLLVFCVEDSGCLEHHDRSGYHVRCADEAACGKRREERVAATKARKAAAAAAKAAKEAVAPIGQAVLKCALAQYLEGLVACTARVECTLGEVTSSLKEGGGWQTYTEATLPDGRRCVVYDTTSYDDYRTYYWVPADVLPVAARQWAEQNGVTPENAREWLAKYGDCHGSELYRVVAGIEEKGAKSDA